VAAYNIPTRKWTAKPKSNIARAAVSPTTRDLEWAAGFLEGEGCFIRAKSCARGCEMVSVPQKEIKPLLKLQRLFGGNLSTRPTNNGYRMNVWQAYGSRARGLMMTLYLLLSSHRQQQIRLALRGA
jgi:hypothetical protein